MSEPVVIRSEELIEFLAHARANAPTIRRLMPDGRSEAYVVARQAADTRWHVVNRSGLTRTQVDGKPPQTRYRCNLPAAGDHTVIDAWETMRRDAQTRQAYARDHGCAVRFLAILHEQLADFGYECR